MKLLFGGRFGRSCGVALVGFAALSVPDFAHAARDASPGASGPAVVRELVADRTENSRTVVLADGSRRTQFSVVPLHYRDGITWRTIDTELRPAAGETVANTAAGFALRIPESLGDGEQIRVQDGSEIVAFTPRTDTATADVDGDTASFAGVDEATDSSWTSTPSGVKELITLRSAAAPRTFAYGLTLSSGLTPVKLASGAIEIRRPNGKVAGTMPAPWMKDAAGAVSYAASYALAQAESSWRITLSVDDAWVSSSQRQFPIDVDPTYTQAGAYGCQLNSGSPNLSACSGPLQVGRVGAATKRAVIRWDDLTEAIPRDANVLAARLVVGLNSTQGGYTDVDLHGLTRGYNAPSWLKANGPTSWSAAGGDINAVRETTFRQEPGYVGDWITWGMARLAQGWINRTIANEGLLLKSSDENRPSSITIDDGSSDKPPLWEVTWEARAGAPTDATFDQHRISDTESLRVNVATGNLLLTAKDFSLQGAPGPLVELTRVYNSAPDQQYVSSSGFGGGWATNVGTSLRMRESWWDKGRYVRWTDGASYRFDLKPDGTYAPAQGLNATLVERPPNDPDGDGFNVVVADGTRYVFDDFVNGQGEVDNYMQRIIDAQGRSVKVNENNHGFTLIDPSGTRTAAVKEGFVNGQWTDHYDSAEDFDQNTWNYEYGSDYSLDSATTPTGQTSSYSYDGDGRLNAVTGPDGVTTRVSLDQDGRVASVVRELNPADPVDPAQNPTTTYSYNDGTRTTTTVNEFGSVTPDPGDGSTVFTFDTGQSVTSATTVPAAGQTDDDPRASPLVGVGTEDVDVSVDAVDGTLVHASGDFTFANSDGGPVAATNTGLFAYDPNGRISSIAAPAGDIVTVAYDTAGRVISAGLPNAQTTIAYVAALATACDPMASVRASVATDTTGRQVTFCIDAAGGVVAILDPDASSNHGLEDENDPDALAFDDYTAVDCDLEYCGDNDLPAEVDDASRASSAPRSFWGLSDNNVFLAGRPNGGVGPNPFADPKYSDLETPNARLIVPWDLMSYPANSYARRFVEEWIDQALLRQRNLLVAFEKCHNPNDYRESAACNSVTALPTAAQYAAATGAFVDAHPEVGQYESWNEPNNRGQPTSSVSSGASAAAGFYVKLAAKCAGSCRVAAGSFIDGTNGLDTYVSSYLRALRGTFVAQFAWHPYSDGQDIIRKPTAADWPRLRKYISAVANYDGKVRRRPSGAGLARIWITEIGAYKRFVRANQPINNDGVQQGRVVKAIVEGIEPLNSRINRLYYYNLRGDSGFDTGLLSLTGAPRNYGGAGAFARFVNR